MPPCCYEARFTSPNAVALRSGVDSCWLRIFPLLFGMVMEFFTAPVHLILFAPYGLITLFHLVGLPADDGTKLYCWAGLHILFWPLFVAFMWRLPRFSTRSLRFGAACLVLTVLANLSGCYYDAKKQKMQQHIKTPSEIWLERYPLFPTTDQPHCSPTRSPQKADE